jgi:hypothetical protein
MTPAGSGWPAADVMCACGFANRLWQETDAAFILSISRTSPPVLPVLSG